MNNSAACRMVGVNRKTGNRWFYGRTTTDRAGRQRTYAPITTLVTAVSARYLHQDERVAVADGYAAGESSRADLGLRRVAQPGRAGYSGPSAENTARPDDRILSPT